jgi:hypothetical protein
MAATAVKQTPAKPAPADRAAFALEAAAFLDAEGVNVLADLLKAYRAGCAPAPHQQRFLYAMMRHLVLARAIQAAEARQAEGGGETPAPQGAAPAQPDALAFVNHALGQAELELLEAAKGRKSLKDEPGNAKERFRAGQIWQCAHYHLCRMQAQMQGLCGEDGAPVAAIAGRLARSRNFAAHAAPPSRLLPFPSAADHPSPVIASAPAAAKEDGLRRHAVPRNDEAEQQAEIPQQIVAESDETSINRKLPHTPAPEPRAAALTRKPMSKRQRKRLARR